MGPERTPATVLELPSPAESTPGGGGWGAGVSPGSDSAAVPEGLPGAEATPRRGGPASAAGLRNLDAAGAWEVALRDAGSGEEVGRGTNAARTPQAATLPEWRNERLRPARVDSLRGFVPPLEMPSSSDSDGSTRNYAFCDSPATPTGASGGGWVDITPPRKRPFSPNPLDNLVGRFGASLGTLGRVFSPRLPPGLRKSERQDSLRDTKVLMTTQLQRTRSIIHHELFCFEDHFEFLDRVGRTPTSEVWLVRHRTYDQLFAIKKSHRPFSSKLERDQHMHEVEAVARLPPHSHIVGHFRAWQQDQLFYIQMEYCEGGSLGDLLRRQGQALLPDGEVWRLCAEVADGLVCLHAASILHLDIKPDNIYLDGEGTFHIGDFGLALLDRRWDWQEGDGQYVAPELLSLSTDPTPAADIFSLGVMLYEVSAGKHLPRTRPDPRDVHIPGRPSAMEALARRMLALEPAERPTAAEVCAAARAALAGISGRVPESAGESGM